MADRRADPSESLSSRSPSTSLSLGREEEAKLDAVLTKAGLLHLKPRFLHEKVSVSVIPFLESKDWDRLGVTAVGDRIVLVQLSKSHSRDAAIETEMSSLFNSTTPSTSKSSGDESFATRAERLCGKILSGTLTSNSSNRRHKKRATTTPRIKEWTKNVVVIDFQGQSENETVVLYDYQKIFDGLIQLSSDMCEEDVREEIVRLVQLKQISTHCLERLTANSVKVVNRKVRSLDGDVPCDGKGLTRVYKSGSIYVRLNDDSLWSKKGKHPIRQPTSPVPCSPVVVDAGPSTSSMPSSSTPQANYKTFVNLIDVEDDADIQRAIEESLCDNSQIREIDVSKESVSYTLSDVLQEHVASNVHVTEFKDQQLIPVRRKDLWKDVVRCINAPNFEFNHGLRIRFIGEEAVDAGGPLREFFRLLMMEIESNAALMCGMEGRRTAVHNTVALDKREFRTVGQCISLSIVYGGTGPHFFSETAAHYLLGLPIANVPKEDIPDHNVVTKIEQIENSDDTESLRMLLDSPEFLFRFDAGCPVPSQTISIDDKGTVARSIAMNFVVYSQKAELDEIKSGFQCLNFSGLVKSHPNLLKPLFVAGGRKKLTAASFSDLFRIEFSPEGSNQRPKEEEIILHWNYYIAELEFGRVIEREDGSGDVLHIGLGDLLSFVTGADHPPPLGFSVSPLIQFTDDPERVLPKASTCTLTLYISIHLREYDAFKRAFDVALTSAHGFGLV